MAVIIKNEPGLASVYTLDAVSIGFDGIEPILVHLLDSDMLVHLRGNVAFYIVRGITGSVFITGHPWKSGKLLFSYEPTGKDAQ